MKHSKHTEIYSPSSDFDCKAALESGKMTSGIYRIQPDSLDPFFVSINFSTITQFHCLFLMTLNMLSGVL